jgi:titin
MKTTFKLIGIIALAALIGFIATACDDDTSINGDSTIPGVPLNVNAIPGNAQATLSWTVPASDGGSEIIRYEVNRSGAETWVTATSPHVFSGLTNDTLYTFRVRAVNAKGPSEPATTTATPVAGNQTPLVTHYSFTNLTQNTGSVTAVEITPNPGVSPGAITIWYVGTGGTTYARSQTPPQIQGTFTVTFDVAAATGWNAATGLPAGTLNVNNQTPLATHYAITNLTQNAGSVTDVVITPNPGVSPGAITIWYVGTGGTTYARSQTPPQIQGTFAVTFDVAAATGWNAATGLPAGNLTVNPQLFPDLPGNVTITPSGTVPTGTLLTTEYTGSTGEIPTFTWNRNGEAISNATGYTFMPTEAGSYTVTASATGFNPKTSTAVTVVTALTDFTFTPTENLVIGFGEPGYNGTGMSAIVGSFSAPVGGQQPFTFSLVEGEGDTDNTRFNIFGTNLHVGMIALTEVKTYSVRVQIRENNFPNLTFAKAVTFVVNWPPAGTPSAVISSGSISGMLPNSDNMGSSDVNTELPSINLTNARLRDDVTIGTNVTSWFNPTIAGLSYTIDGIFNMNDQIVIKVEGTPATTSSAAVTITIPANMLLDRNGNPSITQGLVVTGDIGYNITVAPENFVRVGEGAEAQFFQSIQHAISETTGAQTIFVLRNHTISSTIIIPVGRTIIIRAATDGVTITRSGPFPIFAPSGNVFLNIGNGSGGNAGPHNPTLILHGGGFAGGSGFIEIGQGAVVNFWNGVELRNTNNQGTAVRIWGELNNRGNFGMVGGVIAGFSTGVHLQADADFTMNGGIIYGTDQGANSNNTSVNRGAQRTTIFGTVPGITAVTGGSSLTFGTAP